MNESAKPTRAERRATANELNRRRRAASRTACTMLDEAQCMPHHLGRSDSRREFRRVMGLAPEPACEVFTGPVCASPHPSWWSDALSDQTQAVAQ